MAEKCTVNRVINPRSHRSSTFELKLAEIDHLSPNLFQHIESFWKELLKVFQIAGWGKNKGKAFTKEMKSLNVQRLLQQKQTVSENAH